MSIQDELLGLGLYRDDSEGNVEEQLNNVIDRGLKLYLSYIALSEAGDFFSGSGLEGNPDSLLENVGEGAFTGSLSGLLGDNPFVPKRLSSLQRLFG